MIQADVASSPMLLPIVRKPSSTESAIQPVVGRQEGQRGPAEVTARPAMARLLERCASATRRSRSPSEMIAADSAWHARRSGRPSGLLGACGHHLCILPAGSEKLLVRPLLDDPPSSSTTILSAPRTVLEPVGDHQRGAPAEEFGERRLDVGVGFGIEVGGRLVEDHEGRVEEERARKREALRLPAAQPGPALAGHRVVSLGQAANERVGMRGGCGGNDLVQARFGPAEADVVGHRCVEQIGRLGHVGHAAPPFVGRERRQIHPIDCDLAAL